MEQKTRLIGLTGCMGSGKSTVAAYLQTQGYVELSFAEPIKQIGLIFGFSRASMYGSQAEKAELHPVWGVSGRTFMQKFGTELGRDLLPSVLPSMSQPWLRLTTIKITQNPLVVVSDVRFPNEATLIRELGGEIWSLERPSFNVTPTDLHPSALHTSETQVQSIVSQYQLYNSGTLPYLYKQVDDLLQT